MIVYGIFETISDYEFFAEDILSKNKDGQYLMFVDKKNAVRNLPKDNLDAYSQGTTYEIKPIYMLDDN